MVYISTSHSALLVTPNLIFSAVSSHGSEDFPIKYEEKDLRERLTPEQYAVTQSQGTERYSIRPKTVEIYVNVPLK